MSTSLVYCSLLNCAACRNVYNSALLGVNLAMCCDTECTVHSSIGRVLTGQVDFTARKLWRRSRPRPRPLLVMMWVLVIQQQVRRHQLRQLQVVHHLLRHRQSLHRRCRRSASSRHGQQTKWRRPSCGALHSPTLSLWVASLAYLLWKSVNTSNKCHIMCQWHSISRLLHIQHHWFD